MPGRRRALEVLALKPGERVLIVGIGTGADLPFLQAGVEATGIDVSPDMLAKARKKLPKCHARVELIQGDAQVQHKDQAPFDAAILNLILSVVPDGHLCLQSATKALKPGGRAVIFDKFMPDQGRLTFGRWITNLFSTLFGTDITRRFGDIRSGCDFEVLLNEPSLMKGTYRVILVKKRGTN